MKIYDAQGREKLPVDATTAGTTSTGKNLGASLPAGRTLTTLYVVPASTRASDVRVMCANRGTSSARFRLSHAVGGVADSSEHYLYYDVSIPPQRSFEALLGIEMGATDELRVYSDNGQVAFNAYGQEIT